jgi:hypothetical protein
LKTPLEKIENCFKVCYYKNELEVFSKFYNEVFTQTLETISKLQVNAKLPNVKDLTKYQQFIDILLNFFFSSSVSLRDCSGVWVRIKELCMNYLDNLMILSKWKDLLLKETTKLVDTLLSIEDLNKFLDPQILPFENLPMKKEYVLQVLIDAYYHKTDKYKTIHQTQLYLNIFDPWIHLLNLIEIPNNFSNKASMIKYCESNLLLTFIALYEIINKISPLDKEGKASENKKLSEPGVFPPPNSTIFV